jgi:hypothetical protein
MEESSEHEGVIQSPSLAAPEEEVDSVYKEDKSLNSSSMNRWLSHKHKLGNMPTLYDDMAMENIRSSSR